MLSESVAVAIDAQVAGEGAGDGVSIPDAGAGERGGGSSSGVADGARDCSGSGRADDDAARGTGDTAQGSDAAEGGLFSSLRTSIKAKFASLALWAAGNIRRVAHTVEFAFVGLFASAAAVCLLPRGFRSWRARVPVVAFCAACSLIDQTHKLFVPGRHFDPVDLVFDAAGYLLACAVVFAIARVAAAIKARPRS